MMSSEIFGLGDGDRREWFAIELNVELRRRDVNDESGHLDPDMLVDGLRFVFPTGFAHQFSQPSAARFEELTTQAGVWLIAFDEAANKPGVRPASGSAVIPTDMSSTVSHQRSLVHGGSKRDDGRHNILKVSLQVGGLVVAVDLVKLR
jgi:hypothetical protein